MATNNAVNNSLNGQTGTGTFVGATSPTLITPNIGVATATSLVFSPTTGGIVGTATNNNAAAGYVGEYIESNIPFASAVNILTATPTNVTSISLTAGDWDVDGNTFVVWATDGQAHVCGISLVSATLPDNSRLGGIQTVTPAILSYSGAKAGSLRVSTNSTITVYLVAQVTINTPGLASICGNLSARRAR